MAVRRVPDAARYGTVQLMPESNRWIWRKDRNTEPGIINAGVYVFQRASSGADSGGTVQP